MITQFALLVTILACTFPSTAQPAVRDRDPFGSQTLSSPPGHAGLQRLVDRFSNAVNAKDAKALAACFTEDGEFTNPVGMTEKGRTAIEAFHTTLFARVRQPNTPSFAEARLEVLSSAFKLLRPDVASIDVRWRQEGAIAPDGKPWGTRMGILSWVAVRNNDMWLIAVWHNLELPKQ